MKKRYWKLSLLVHPDKCTHPKAHEAFTALNQAFKDLQDPMKRADQQIQEKETREELEAELKAKREAAEWRKTREFVSLCSNASTCQVEDRPEEGSSWENVAVKKRFSTSFLEDEALCNRGVGPKDLNELHTQQSTFFSRYAKSGRGDTSIWMDTPMDKVRKAKMAFLEGERQSMLGDESAVFHKEERDPATAGIMDQFNSAKRGMSPVEKHQMEHTKVKKAPNKKEAPQPAEWEVSHPWKPWDRDKDLTAGRQKVTLDKSNMAEGLSSRFAASHKERSFL
ncbi:hypothetical protein GOP47_0002843 [Adiantum capillus-veneris]|uniref:J domain-containing protein n=1 Tax=Adiantum capillus-veneris TaxID=13818 RepID=A0A9D4VAV0_ADICA|nr:hypothetical protein GOP47_0002843 [Adiantum capillus-veneris]